MRWLIWALWYPCFFYIIHISSVAMFVPPSTGSDKQPATFLPLSFWAEFTISNPSFWSRKGSFQQKQQRKIKPKCEFFGVKGAFYGECKSWKKAFYCLLEIYLTRSIFKCVEIIMKANPEFHLDWLLFCHNKQRQQITQHAIHYRPGGPASILPHCSFTTCCQRQSLNNVSCSHQKVIQFKTCFALLCWLSSSLTVPLSNMYTNQM